MIFLRSSIFCFMPSSFDPFESSLSLYSFSAFLSLFFSSLARFFSSFAFFFSSLDFSFSSPDCMSSFAEFIVFPLVCLSFYTDESSDPSVFSDVFFCSIISSELLPEPPSSVEERFLFLPASFPSELSSDSVKSSTPDSPNGSS